MVQTTFSWPAANSPCPRPRSSLPSRKTSLRLGDAGVRCMTQCKSVDRRASCWEIQKGGSPFGRFKRFPKGENEIPVTNRKPSVAVCGWKGRTGKRIWRRRALRGGGMERARSDARFHPVSFCTSRKKWGGFLRTATRDAVRTNTSSDRPLGGHLPLEGKALKVRSAPPRLPPLGEAVAAGD